MQTVQRRFGKFLPRTADESQVSVLLKDFEDADKMLAKIIEASKAWRDSWRDILNTQQKLVHGFESMYAPIIGAGEEYEGHIPVVTDEHTLARTARLQQTYEELRTELLEEVNVVEARIIQPATDAKAYLQPLKKVIKKREDKKLDFEKYQSRVDNARKKTKRSERDNASLDKAESELVRAKEEYAVADDRIRDHLPGLITSVFSILPRLLAAQIMTQNTMLAHYYTALHDYCDEERFPDPPPSAQEIVSTWDADFRPIRQQVESSILCVATGKTATKPMRLEERPSSLRNGSSYSSNRRPSGNALIAPPSPAMSASSAEPIPLPSPEPSSRPRISSIPSQTSLSLATPNYNTSSLLSPTSDGSAHAPAGPRADYFGRDRMPSNSSLASIAAAKKKPPPPPPPKRLPSSQGTWVKALYDFTGEGHGDLSFREGDKIKVVKKTDSTDDWWEGDLRGVLGSFPANYCQPA